MATKHQMVSVSSEQALEQTITGYIAEGYVIQNRTPDAVVLFKKKEFSILWAVIGLVICFIPLLVYLIVYAADSDKLVEIRVDIPVTQWSDDGRYWWDGTQWVEAQQPALPVAPVAPQAPAAGTTPPVAPEDDIDIVIKDKQPPAGPDPDNRIE